MSSKYCFNFAILALLITALACNISVQDNSQPTVAVAVVDGTKVALEIQATMLAGQLTAQAVEVPVEAATETPIPEQPVVDATATQPEPTVEDMASQIKNAKILVYEDAGNTGLLVPWVKSTLDLMGLKYVHDGDALGNFMGHLNSGTPWDLIIVAGESRKGVQGEFWDVITPKVTNDKTALIVEMWYLSQTANGRIKALTSKCGIEFQSTRQFVDSIYTVENSSPFFSNPNSGFSLTNFAGYWTDKGGDYVRLSGSGDAVLLAGGSANETSRSGLLTSCLEGRVIIQTFSSHDYRREPMQMLWENYITNTLTNHFKALP
jgi:hypothetical protein